MPRHKYDIFISYRRDTGQQYARILQMALEKIGYRVFLDYDEIKDGVFGDNIRQAVIDAPIFMPVLSSQYLARCKNEGDWVREEIMLAIEHKKHFIPVNPDGKHDGIPEDIPEEIIRVISDNQHSEIMLGKMLNATLKLMVDERIRPHVKPSFTRRLGKNVGLIVLALALVVGVGAVLLSNHFQDVSKRKDAFTLCKTKAQHEDFIKTYPNTSEARTAKEILEKMERLKNNRIVYTDNTRDDEILDKRELSVVWNKDITLLQLEAIVEIFDHMMCISAKDCSFTVGKDDDFPYDGPAHKVTLTEDYYICQFETTRSWWHAVMNDSLVTDSVDYPISNITWHEAKEFCKRLESLTDIHFSLPTEAQWEYAARGNEDFTFSGSNDADEVAWHKGNSEQTLHPVAQLESNARDFQLFDMSGNVAEWCLDDMSRYTAEPQTDPLAGDEETQSLAVVRGGSIETLPDYLDVRHREPQTKALKNPNVGFRISFKKP